MVKLFGTIKFATNILQILTVSFVVNFTLCCTIVNNHWFIYCKFLKKYEFCDAVLYLLSQRQILGRGNLPQDSAPICINIDISPEMAAQKAQ